MQVNWQPTTEDRYWEMLEVLPPRYMGQWGFLVGEPEDHAICSVTGRGAARYGAYLDMGENAKDRFFVADRPLTVPEFKAAPRP